MVVGVGVWTEHLENGWLLSGYASFLAGAILAGVSLFSKDRTWVGRLARWLPVVVFVVVFAVLVRAFGGDNH